MNNGQTAGRSTLAFLERLQREPMSTRAIQICGTSRCRRAKKSIRLGLADYRDDGLLHVTPAGLAAIAKGAKR